MLNFFKFFLILSPDEFVYVILVVCPALFEGVFNFILYKITNDTDLSFRKGFLAFFSQAGVSVSIFLNTFQKIGLILNPVDEKRNNLSDLPSEDAKIILILFLFGIFLFLIYSIRGWMEKTANEPSSTFNYSIFYFSFFGSWVLIYGVVLLAYRNLLNFY